jgi:hypothetical protein
MRPSNPTTEPNAAPEANGQKRRKRLERELAKLGATETRRLDRLKKVQERAATIRRELAEVQARPAGTSGEPGFDGSLTGPTGYCMRERRRVTISDPVSRTLANGRSAIVGACSSCGVRVTVYAARPVQIGG